jgi:hypothetical protein
LGEIQLGLRHADPLDVLPSRRGQDGGLRIGVADVLAGEDRYAPGNEARIFTCREHAGEPIRCCIGVAPAHRLDERTCQVVVLIAAAVVDQRLGLDGLFGNRQADDHRLRA